MSDSRHTPGPWKLGRGNAITAKWRDGEQVQVCAMFATQFTGATKESRAANDRMSAETEDNARLIAAAPELLEALKKCRGFLLECSDEDTPITNQLITQIEAVIQKVESGE